MSQVDSSKKSPFKKTDFRHDLWIKERKALREKAKKKSFKVEVGPTGVQKNVVTVDTSNARSNIDVLRICLKKLGWREYPFGKKDGGICDITWHSVQFSDGNVEVPGGKVNKFPGIIEILRKVNLGRSLDVMRKLFPDEYNFHPQQWFLPQQFAEFSDACRRMNIASETSSRPVFIVKPDEGSQGDGIYLIHEPKQYIFCANRNHVVQEYIADPFIVDNLKFDFRVYVVIASLDPLEVYICKEGLARFCTVPYDAPTNKNIREAYMHLTNYSLNKYSETYVRSENEEEGSKRTMSSVFRKIAQKGYDVERVWSEIKNLVAKTCIAIAGELKVEYHAALPPQRAGPSCFQILGFDILLTDTCKPILLEVNASPSLRIDYENEVAPGIFEHLLSPIDEEIKRPLVLDTLLLIAPKGRRTTKYMKNLEKEVININLIRRVSSRAASSPSRGGPETSEGSDSEDEQYQRPKRSKRKGYGTLEQIYPGVGGAVYDDLRIMERLAVLFLECIGVRGHLRMGSTGFRNFTRRCRIVGPGSGFTNAALDIMFIDCCRRWDHTNLDSAAGGGLCYQGFLEIFVQLATKKFEANHAFGSFQALLEHCEEHMGESIREKRGSARISGRGTMFPSISKSEASNDDRLSVYKGSGRKKVGQSYFLDYRNFSTDSESKIEPLYAKKSLSRSKSNLSNTGGVRLRKFNGEGKGGGGKGGGGDRPE